MNVMTQLKKLEKLQFSCYNNKNIPFNLIRLQRRRLYFNDFQLHFFQTVLSGCELIQLNYVVENRLIQHHTSM